MITRLISDCALHELDIKGDARGSLVAIQELGFAIERVYYLFRTTPGIERGFHAHKALRQFAVCVSGACTFVLDDGRQRQEVRLDRPNLALSIGSMVWREMRQFSEDCVLLVLASAKYDEHDYIRDYDTFLCNVAGESAL
jgi:dTDP-4-dehydrorhamnose 3,5-epimerase-like enzyme